MSPNYYTGVAFKIYIGEMNLNLRIPTLLYSTNLFNLTTLLGLTSRGACMWSTVLDIVLTLISHLSSAEGPLKTGLELQNSNCTLYIAHSTLMITHSRTQIAHFTLHTTDYTLHSSNWSLHTAHNWKQTSELTLHTTHYTIYIAYCILHNAQCILHTTHCTFEGVDGGDMEAGYCLSKGRCLLWALL